MSEKKATDVLRDLDSRVFNMEKYLSQIDMNVKILLNKINAIASPTASKPMNLVPSTTKTTTTTKVEPSEKKEKPILMNPSKPEKKEIISNKKCKVEQVIVYEDGRPVILALVKILDIEVPTNLIAKTTTTSHGKWSVQLFGGKYLVEIVKGPTSSKKGFRIQYEIDIPNTGKPTSLKRRRVNLDENALNPA